MLLFGIGCALVFELLLEFVHVGDLLFGGGKGEVELVLLFVASVELLLRGFVAAFVCALATTVLVANDPCSEYGGE